MKGKNSYETKHNLKLPEQTKKDQKHNRTKINNNNKIENL